MAVWTAKVTIGNIVSTYPAPGPFGYVGPLTTFQYYAFGAKDLVDVRYPMILVTYRINGTGTALETFEQHGFSTDGSVTNFVPGGVGHEFTGTNEFETGGPVTIVKDETADEYQFTGILGSSDFTFASLGTVNDGELAPAFLEMFDVSVSTFDDALLFASTSNDTVLTVRFNDFYGQKDAVDIKGATLATGDRGSWVPPSPSTAFDPWNVTKTATMNAAIADTGAAVGFNFTTDVASAPPTPSGVAYQEWDQAVYLGGVTIDGMVDMTRAVEHGSIWAAIIYSTNPTELKTRRSFDTGGTWEEVLAYSSASANSSISIVWNGGKLLAAWQSGADILQSFSRDMGTTWSTPVTLAITGTNPRLLARPDGIAFYFFFDGDDLNLIRSADFGTSFLDASPILVAAGVGAQTVGAQFGSDGSLVVGYIVSSTWTQLRSRDLGLTWS